MAARSGAEDEQHPHAWTMATEQLYRDRAKEAREKAAVAKDETTRQLLLEIAKGFERLADLLEETPWHVERVERK
jgi:bacterioferritin (cytochrome b1)